MDIPALFLTLCTASSLSCRYSGLITGRRARLIIAIFWILSFFIGLTPFLGWSQSPSPSRKADVLGCGNVSAARGSHPHPAGNATHECRFLNVVDMQYMIYFNFLGCVLTPLLLMLVIYVKIFTVARRQLQKIELSSVGSDSSRTFLQNQVRVAKSLSVIVGLFAFCWLPLHTINCLYYFHPRLFRTLGPKMVDAAIILSHANSVGNPIIYAYKIREFRNTFHKIICQQILRREGSNYENDASYSSSPQTLKTQSL